VPVGMAPAVSSATTRISMTDEIHETLMPASVVYFVRPLDGSVQYDLERVRSFLERRGVVRAVPLGASFVRSARARAVCAQLTAALHGDEHFFLRNEAYVGAQG